MDYRTRGVVVGTAERLGTPDRPGINAQIWRIAFAVVWPPVLVALIYGAFGRLGFFPTDEGLTLANGYRLLHGQVPHRDFASIRPVGSAVLHLVDFAIPGPLFEVSRVIALCEYVAYTMLFAWLVYQVAPSRWSVPLAAMAAAAVMLNLNRFPLMAWYTVDGLLLVGAGLVVVDRGVHAQSWRVIAAGFVVIGLAALTKQSFLPATGLGWILLWPRLRAASWPERARDVLLSGAYGALPFLIYVAVFVALAGFHTVRSQLLAVPPIYGMPLLYSWLPDRDLWVLLALCAASAVTAARTTYTGLARWLGPFVAAAMTAVAIVAALSQGLGLRGDEWGIRLFWMAVVYVAVSSLARRSIDIVGVAVVGTAWMASLSFSYFYPNLMGGSLAIYLVHSAWSGTAWPEIRWARLAPAVAAVAALVMTSVVFTATRTQDVYLDRQAGQLSSSLGSVSPAFGGIRTNTGTATYLAQMKACIDRYPARYVAILPENAAMYPALSLTNPFPIDWMWTYDVHGSEMRIAAAADDLNRTGDYLVLFQTADDSQIIESGSVPDATSGSAVYAFTPLPGQIYTRLNGTKTTCGSFLVVYSPPT